MEEYTVIETADWLSALWRQVWDTKKSIEWREIELVWYW